MSASAKKPSGQRKRRRTTTISAPTAPITPQTFATATPTSTDSQSEQPISASDRLSAKEKVNIILTKLREWRLSPIKFIEIWLAYLEEDRGYIQSMHRKALLDLVLQFDDIVYLLQTADRGLVAVIDSSVALIRSDLDQLQSHCPLLSRYNKETDFKTLDLASSADQIKNIAPRLSRLISGAAESQYVAKHQRTTYSADNGRMVMTASMLGLRYAQKTMNCFARMLGLYLKDSGLTRRGLSTLHSLGLVDGYRTLDAQKQRISEQSRERGP
ncbi:MAG: hypothetical protein M1819_001211 [Sarea resinae]|nr:MAG: hypothetical protein M1819_001211 [Sarea resinae]